LHSAQTYPCARFHVSRGFRDLQTFSLVRNFHAHRAVLALDAVIRILDGKAPKKVLADFDA